MQLLRKGTETTQIHLKRTLLNLVQHLKEYIMHVETMLMFL